MAMIFLSIIISLLFLAHGGIAQQQDPLPVQLPQVAIEGGNDGTCPSAEVAEQARNSTKEEIRSILRDTVVPILDPTSIHARCRCGGPGLWRRIVHLNMSDPNQQCPPNWTLITTPTRACARSSTGCSSATFLSNSMPYSRVCGRINALQIGIPDAFSPGFHNPSLEGVYVDGISLTHGAAGSRQHIWTFAAAAFETGDPLYTGHAVHALCPCMNTNWPYQIPSFVGNNYFCDTGNPNPVLLFNELFADDPM